MLRTLAEFLVLAGLVYGGLSLIGLPVRTWLLDEPGGRTSAAPAAFVGVALVQLVTWYWLEFRGTGAHGLGLALVVVGAVASAVTLPRALRHVRREPKRHLAPVLGALGGAVVYVLAFSALFRVGFQTTASLENLDAPSYAESARHLIDGGFDDSGHISGIDLGVRLRIDAFGSSAVLGEAGDATGLGIWKLTMPCIFVFVVLGTSTLSRLLDELFEGRSIAAAAAATAAAAGILSTYVAGQYFLGQVIAMALAPALVLVAVRAVQPAGFRTRVRQAGAAAVLLVILLSHYSQMIVPIVAVLVPGVVLLRGLRDAPRAFARVAGVLVGGGAAAVAVAPQWLDHTIDQSQTFAQITVGWPLPGFLPIDVLGFTSTVYNRENDLRTAGSVLVVLALLGGVLVLGRRVRGALWAAVASVLILVSYAAVYHHEGGASYRQWKWITFFQPTFAAATTLVVALAIAQLLGAHGRSWTRAVPVVLCVAVGVVAFRESREPYGPKLAGQRPMQYVDAGLAELQDAPGLAGIEALNIDVAEGWDTMWAPYFLPHQELYIQSAGYYPRLPADAAAWTLTPRIGDLGGPPYIPLTPRFRAEAPFTGPTSVQPTGLDARIDVESWSNHVDPGGTVVGRVVVTNTGTTSWLPPEAGEGGVYFGVHLATPTGHLVDTDFSRLSMVPGWRRPILPGGTVTFDVAFPAPPPGAHILQLQLVSELVTWFGAPTAVPIDVGPAAAMASAASR